MVVLHPGVPGPYSGSSPRAQVVIADLGPRPTRVRGTLIAPPLIDVGRQWLNVAIVRYALDGPVASIYARVCGMSAFHPCALTDVPFHPIWLG